MSTWASAASVWQRQVGKSCLLELRQAYSAVAAVSHDARIPAVLLIVVGIVMVIGIVTVIVVVI